jgi:gluconate 2-dehydrogenase gamma chain
MNQISRRDALKRLSLLVGGTLSASTVSAVLGGCGLGGKSQDYVFQTLSVEQVDLVAAIAEVIIPATDTPGARAAGVDQFIDLMLSGWMRPDERASFLIGLKAFDQSFEKESAKKFTEAGVKDQLAFMDPLDREAARARLDHQTLPFFGRMKELVVTGYYSSEIGATQELRHQMIFPKYDGNVELAPGDRAWS